MPRIDVARVVVMPALLLLLAAGAGAQTTTATLEGTVTDASGAVIPGAEVTVTGTALAGERRATTDARGVYRLTALPAGTYTYHAWRPGGETLSGSVTIGPNKPLDIRW